ncbi:hypothetical protein VE01_07405 [Pseudogymnoascus verrucosus]|uniref:Uncharacterized protein n=1 Tax=Pseudogymnoascus verrucosus TaxID=342668 RepID=A0A1B8GH37_9PEZI|nr:uncharacterized protein VE01_07405 [Pseudogymnoascus verrucosus]OBT95141.1 hypothetical protein VE01_07405 [Pseudogymnoascus verrucosus]
MNPPEDSSKVTTEDYIGFMKEYGIEFEGRILPEKWGEYTAMFEDIRRIGELGPKEFIEMFHPDDKYLDEKRIKASELVNEAWNCLKNMDSEYGWRKEVEFTAFERFDSEVVCHVCLYRRWKPKFEAKPIDRVEAERLQKRRGRRHLCTCTLLQRAGPNVDSQYSRMFAREIDKHMDHEDLPEHLKKRLRRRPDRVIGLGATHTLRHYLPNLRTKYCPFRSANVIYPFIVIEAKTAESKDASFGSILRQTAFVTRTCLRLQQNLQEDTGIPHQCIVWSFAIIGEEWRLYAAVPDGSKVQIFDIWHGSVLFPEGSLQLLLIIDYLCDWASDIYRMSIIKCITGGGPNTLNSRLSPSGTDISSLAGDSELIALRAMSLPSRSSLAPELSNGDMDGLASSSSSEFPEVELLVQVNSSALLNRPDTYSWQRWATAEQNQWPWVQKATIRHSSRVELRSLQVTMPEEIHLLRACLESWFPGLSVKDAAKKVLISLQDDNLAVTTSVNATYWQNDQSKESILEVRALVYFRSRLSSEEWHIKRQVLSILCSEKAIEAISHIANLSFSIRRSFNGRDRSQCEQFLRAINSLNLVGGTRSASLALGKSQLSLQVVTDSAGSPIFEWSKFTPQRDDGVTGDEFCGILSRTLNEPQKYVPDLLTPYVKNKSFMYTIPIDSDCRGSPVTAFELLPFRTKGILVKNSKTTSVKSIRNFCFLITDENVQFDDEARLGQLLEETYKAGELFAMVKANETYDQADRTFIRKWIRILKGQLPQDTLVE